MDAPTPQASPHRWIQANDWSKYGDYETRYAAWADFAEVFAGAEGARGADGVGVARGVGYLVGHGHACG